MANACTNRRVSKGFQLLAAYTYSKAIDSASTFEEVQNPINDRANRSLSLYDARQRLVLSYVWELPIPKYTGAKGKQFGTLKVRCHCSSALCALSLWA